MKALNERLKRMQEEQAARQKDLEHGRIRIERPAPEKSADHQQPKKAAG
jgi:hypothetical protein